MATHHNKGSGLRRGGLWVARGVALAMLLAIFVALAILFYLRSALPQTEGQLEAPGLLQPVEIWRDGDGIPTLRARNEPDAYFALGFLHAQDRLWQMDSMRRIGAGRLSEVVGSATLNLDRMMRTLELYRVAQDMYPRLSDGAQAALTAYTKGVNAQLSTRLAPLPAAFQILDYEPEPWTPADSIVWGNLMALQLSGDWRDEILRMQLSDRLDEAAIDFLWPSDSPDSPTTLKSAAIKARPTTAVLESLSRALPWSLGPKSASNWWVLSGDRSTTGAPLLANDPHLALSAPGTWYLARLEWPGQVLAGVTAPGVPFPIIAHNGRIAWGFTTTHSDTQDLFIEQLSADGLSSRTEQNWEPLQVREEVIESADGPPVTIQVRRSRHGVLISDAVSEVKDILDSQVALALSWPLYDPESRSPEAFYRLTKAADRTEFLDAMRLMSVPQQNVAYADAGGGIGFISAGWTPLRRSGDGSRALPGWSADSGWDGYIPFEDLPQAFDPEGGTLINANNRVAGDGYPYHLSRYFPDPARFERIAERLTEQQSFNPMEAAAIQLDILSITARELLPLMLSQLSVKDRQLPEITALAAWDHKMSRDRPEPLIFAAWMRHLMRALIADEVGTAFDDLARPDRRLISRILEEAPEWCDDVSTLHIHEACAEQVATALLQSLDELRTRLGGDWRQWRWGQFHLAPFQHPVFGRVPLVADALSLATETDGWDDTVNRGGTVLGWSDPNRMFQHRHGAALRALFDLSNLDQSLFMIAPGQSDNPLSPYYGNFVTRWRDGHYVKLVGKTTAQGPALLLTPVQ